MNNPLSLTADIQNPDPNIPQRQAADPVADVWVAASAGSGKTKVLTDRVLRLLLPDPQGRWVGADPHRILCITFTKAAAALMALRVQKKLGEWAVMGEKELYEDIQKLLGEPPTELILATSRKLFSTVLDVTGGLSIMTIHSFCQSTLGRFAIEAGITPGFDVLDESLSQDLLRRSVEELIRGIESGDNQEEIKKSFGKIATYMDLDKLRLTLMGLTGKAHAIGEFIRSCGKIENIQPTLLHRLGYAPDMTLQNCFEEFLSRLPDKDLARVAEILGKSGARDGKNGQKLADWIALGPADKAVKVDWIQEAFLTKEGKVKEINKATLAAHPEITDIREQVLPLVARYLDQKAVLRQVEQTVDMLHIVDLCLVRYTARKKERNALDFNDLILKTRNLLESRHMDWVQFKLDEGIDHILVDEAQDTNGHQWDIIRRLSSEFFTGDGQNNRRRSLFVVGDEKQSIFSFHGADPEAFQTMRDFFAKRSEDANRKFLPVRLETSFRSTFPVLQLVDEVFARPDLLARLGLPASQELVHYSYRSQYAGLVEIWDPIIREKPDVRNDDLKWRLPPVSIEAGESGMETASSSSPLAARIALTIWGWIEKGEALKSQNRPVEPRDILVLVRTRTPFVSDLVRQLKLRGIAVSGIDRMMLTDQIAIMDCLALARFCRFPEDDLSLACLLRSPFIRIQENELMAFALGRQGTLWDVVQQRCSPDIVSWLRHAISMSGKAKPFDFFDDILNGQCPMDGTSSAWRAFATCLGTDCLDPLDEFLTYCLALEGEGVFSIEELIARVEKSELMIKRDTEGGDQDGPNQVRIMTVHASKGLEAPIVFLPDTMSVPAKSKIDALQWIKGNENQLDTPLWAAKSSDGCEAYQSLKDEAYDRQISEHMRLLYVALTRPQDRLYIMGESKKDICSELCWYHFINEAVSRMADVQTIGTIRRIESPQLEPSEQKKQKDLVEKNELPVPEWASHRMVEDKISPSLIIQPSRLGDAEDQARSPLDVAGQSRFRRGVLTHKLFQILPDLPKESREKAALNFLNRTAHDLGASIHKEIVNETLKILNDPVFADVFGENSLAEVPVSGDMGNGTKISGQIDRLIIGHKNIIIVDFKTNRPSPRHEKDIPAAYIKQLKAYKTALSMIYPDKDILCALLWTDQPLLMPVSV